MIVLSNQIFRWFVKQQQLIDAVLKKHSCSHLVGTAVLGGKHFSAFYVGPDTEEITNQGHVVS